MSIPSVATWAVPPLATRSIFTASLPNAVLGRAYSKTLVGQGGAEPYTFSLAAGTLPTGIALVSPTISGTASAGGSFPVTIKMVDAEGFEILKDFVLKVLVERKILAAPVALNDNENYYDGFKPATAARDGWDTVHTGGSYRDGQIETATFGLKINDGSKELRELLDNPAGRFLTNKPFQFWITDDERRRQELEQMLLANGYVSDYKPGDIFHVRGHDALKRRLGKRASSIEFLRKVGLTDFPNASGFREIAGGGELTYSSLGLTIPMGYGRITDSHMEGSVNAGDGQMVPIDIGDYVINGVVMAGALLLAHDGYIEDGFIDNSAVDIETDPDWLTPRNATAWAAAGFTQSYHRINNRDHFIIYLGGTAREKFVGITPPLDAGSTPLAVNVWGRKDGGDSGALITNGVYQYLDCLRNYLLPEEPWQSGPPLPWPKFEESPQIDIVDEASFVAAAAVIEARLAGGYELNFLLGANNANETKYEVMAQFLSALDLVQYMGTFWRISVYAEPADLSGAKEGMNDVLEIVRDGLDIDDEITRTMANIVGISHTTDYVGRAQREWKTEWRSVTSPVQELRDQQSIDDHEMERLLRYQFRFIRGKNRESDSEYYVQGTATVEDVARRVLARYSRGLRKIVVKAPFSALRYQIGDVFPLTHLRGIGANGWVNRHVLVQSRDVLLSKGQVVLTCYDFERVLDVLSVLPAAA